MPLKNKNAFRTKAFPHSTLVDKISLFAYEKYGTNFKRICQRLSHLISEACWPFKLQNHW